MTLSDPEWPFCVKVCPWDRLYWVCMFWLSDKTDRKFAELRTYRQRQNVTHGTPVSGDVSFVQLFTGFPAEEASNRRTVFRALTITDVLKISNIQEYLGLCYK